jgi:hypothetical protein
LFAGELAHVLQAEVDAYLDTAQGKRDEHGHALVLRSSKAVNKGAPPMPSGLLLSAPHPRFRSAVKLLGCNPRCSLDLFFVGKGLAR